MVGREQKEVPGDRLSSEKRDTLYVRMAREDHALLVKAAKERQETVSTFTRRAVLKELATLGMLSEERKRLLEVK
jgi:uncharacterized protein (DUF1778 family)